MGPWAVWTGAGKLSPTGIRSPNVGFKNGWNSAWTSHTPSWSYKAVIEHCMYRFDLLTQLFFRGENNKQEDAVLWNMTSCTLLDICKCFEETVCLRLDAVYTKYGGSILFQTFSGLPKYTVSLHVRP